MTDRLVVGQIVMRPFVLDTRYDHLLCLIKIVYSGCQSLLFISFYRHLQGSIALDLSRTGDHWNRVVAINSRLLLGISGTHALRCVQL